VELGDALAVVGGVTIHAPVAGVVTQQVIAGGGTASTGAIFARILTSDVRASYSNVGSYVSIAAPGGGLPSGNASGQSSCSATSCFGIGSPLPNGGYGYKSGTSMAPPHVTGTAALVRSKCTSLTPGQVVAAITGNARDLGPAGTDPEYGAGLAQA